MKKKLNVLLIQDEKHISMVIKNEFQKSGYEVYYETASSLDSIKAVFQNKIWDVVISKHMLKDICPLEALLFIKKHNSYLPFILVLEKIECNDIVKLIKNGFNNCVDIKHISRLIEIIESEIEEANVREENDKLCENLKNGEECVELIIESMGNGVITTDDKGKITKINKIAKAFTEWNKNSAIGMYIDNVFKLINGRSGETLKSPFNEAINKSSSMGLKKDTMLVSKSGKEYYVSANFSRIVDKQKRILGVVIIFRDITRIRMLEDQVKDEKEQAEAANRAKSVFLANMSHEIRTPLNGIDGMIDLTLLTELTQEQKENLNIAKECSNSLMEVINNILNFSKIEAGKMEIKKDEINIKDLLEKTVKTNIVHGRDKGIELICKINPSLNETFIGDYSKIQHILNNLISNAIKFTNTGSVCIAVQKLREEKNTALLRFSVTDTGIGISPENMNKLFKSFSQVDGTYTKKYGGTGLGLIISKKLAELMSGEISVESIKDSGSTFYLTIKIEKLKNLAQVKKANKDNYKDEKFSNISRKILIVEDNKANQEVLNRMCIKMNHKVKIADNGKEALEILNCESFDLILMDIQMPVMNGIEVTRRIRENEKKSGGHIKIIALTAYAFKDDREKFLKAGMDDYLSKPIIMNDLCKCIENTVSKQNNGTFHSAEYYLNINETNNNCEDGKTSIKKIGLETDKLRKFTEKEDFNNCESTANTIKESATCIKSVIMKNASFRVQLSARRKDIKGIKDQLVIIEEEYNRIKKLV